MAADIVIERGRIITMVPLLPVAEAVAIKDGRILDVGSRERVRNWIGPETQVIDAFGKTVLPGFTDSHIHLTPTGLDMMKIDLGGCRSVEDIQKLVAEKAAKSSAGQWILGAGYNEMTFQEMRPPTRQELDAAAGANPVCLTRLDSHSGVVNSQGWEKLNMPADTQGIGIDEISGEPNGNVRGEANNFVRNAMHGLIDNTTRKEALHQAAKMLLTHGITSVHAMEGGKLFSDLDVEVLLEEEPRLPIHVRTYWQTTDIAKVLKKGLKQIGGCILIDGSIGSRTAALLEPYSDAPDESGVLYFKADELEKFVLEVHREGLQMTFHAIGDAGIEQIITAYEKALLAANRIGHRHRIEHFSLPSYSQVERCVKAGIILSIQPGWAYPNALTKFTLPARLGKRTDRAYPVGSLHMAGAKMCGGSDSPVFSPSVLIGIQGAVAHYRCEERMSFPDAIAMYTTGAAWAGFEERIKGKIAPGYLADIVLLGGDLLNTPTEAIGSIPIEKTIVAGRIAYSSEA